MGVMIGPEIFREEIKALPDLIIWVPAFMAQTGRLNEGPFGMSPHFCNIKLKIFSRHFFYKILKVNPKKSGFRYRNQNNSKHCLSSTRQSVKD